MTVETAARSRRPCGWAVGLEDLTVPRPAESKRPARLTWQAPVYRTVVAILQKNPFYAGAYVYGKSQVETRIVDGAIRKAYGRPRPMEAWTALVHDHHQAYISWAQFEQNQERLARNAFAS